MSQYLQTISRADYLAAIKAKDTGNELFAKEDNFGAIAEYTKGLGYFSPPTTVSSAFSILKGIFTDFPATVKKRSASNSSITNNSSSSINQEPTCTVEEGKQVLTSILSNRAAAYIKIARYDEALQDANLVTITRPEWVKGYYRKGDALLGLRRFHEAADAYKIAIEKAAGASFQDASNESIKCKIETCERNLDYERKGFAIYQLFAGRDICHKSTLTPIQNLIFQFAAQMRNFIYFIVNISTRETVVVDACWDIDGILRIAKSNNLNIIAAALTHHHVDHCGGIPPPPFDQYRIRVDGLAKLLKKLPHINAYVNHGDISPVLNANPEISPSRLIPTVNDSILTIPQNTTSTTSCIVNIQFLHTPGHTHGSQCLLVNSELLLSGDTLFIGSCGRIDFEDSDPKEMFTSLMTRLGNLPDNLIVYPGHDYGGAWTTIGKERANGALRKLPWEEWINNFSSSLPDDFSSEEDLPDTKH